VRVAAHGDVRLADLARSGQYDSASLAAMIDAELSPVLETAIEDARYAPYLERQDREIAQRRADANVAISPALDYHGIAGLSLEMVERLSAARPRSLADAGLIPGITPAAITAVLVASRQRSA
jgi:tRNA uridine 5-carboxymethylaminomethyl modification enzyme